MVDRNQNVISDKAGLLNLADQSQNVSQANNHMGLSKDAVYHRNREAVESGGADTLLDKSRRKPNLKIRWTPR